MSNTATTPKEPTFAELFAELTSELAQADLAARSASQDAGAAREAKGQKAVQTIVAAFTEKIAPDDVRATLLDAGVLKGTVSKIATVLTALLNKDIAVSDVKSLNGSYSLVKQVLLAKSGAGSIPTSAVVSPDGSGVPAPAAKAITPTQALDIIIKTIKNSKDPFSEASKWLTKVTNKITKLTAELAEADEED